MPTGYTAGIKSDTTLKEFVMTCARAMGACISMRDDPANAPIPEDFGKSSYHVKALKSAHADLDDAHKMSDAEAARGARADFEAEQERRAESERKRLAQLAAYERMLKMVEAWSPPTADHVELKKFMRDQITSSINFDCRPIKRSELVLLAPDKWRDKQIQMAEKDIQYHSQHDTEEDKRVKARNEWVRALRASLEQ